MYSFKSQIHVLYLGSRTTQKMDFADHFTDSTYVRFSADKTQLSCSGAVEEDGKTESNACGENGLPAFGTKSNPLIITSVSQLYNFNTYLLGEW